MNKVKSVVLEKIKGKEVPLFLILIICALSLLGWFSGIVRHIPFTVSYIPIAPLTAILFIILCLLFLISQFNDKVRSLRITGIIILILIILVCINIFFGYILNFPWDIENVFLKNPEKIGNFKIGRMSPISALLFIFICICIFEIRTKRTDFSMYLCGSLSLLICIISSVLLIGYLYKAPLLYGSSIIPVALSSSICFLLFSITLLRHCKFKYWTFNLIKSNKIVLQLLRSFLPFAVFTVFLQGFLITNFPVAHKNLTLFVAIILLFVVTFIVIVVIRVSGSLGDKIVSTEQEIKDNEKKLEFYTDNSPMAVIEWDSEFVVKRWTGDSEKIFGWSAKETIGKPIMNLNMIFEPDVPIVEETMEKLTKGINNRVISTNRNYRKDRSIIHCEWYNTILKNENGEMQYVLSQVLDITSRKQYEEQLLRMNADKDIFLSILSHDLKNPFNILLGFSEILTEDISKLNFDKIEIIAKEINKCAQNAYNLLEDILVWARSQSGKVPFRPQNLILSDVCTAAVESLKPLADIKNITINYFKTSHITVCADNDMLKTILRNLISNAIKFTNKDGRIEIDAEESGQNITVSVCDNGVGISEDNLKKLFVLTDVLTIKGTAEETGTGLGLVLCKDFVEKHGGKIWAESKVSEGSTFFFTIPFNSNT